MLDEAGFGIKTIHVRPGNAAKGLVTTPATLTLFDRITGEVTCFMNATYLTALRTASGSAAATRVMAKNECAVLIVFGAGLQAELHVMTMVCVRPMLRKVVLVNRSVTKAEALVYKLKTSLMEMSLDGTGRKLDKLPEFEIVESGSLDFIQRACGNADIICCTTGSPTPLFKGEWIKDDVHINAVGSYQPHTSELDVETFRRCHQVVVDTEEAITVGDIANPIKEGVLNLHEIGGLGSMLQSSFSRAGKGTLFKSAGNACQDISTGYYILSECEKRQIGTIFNL